MEADAITLELFQWIILALLAFIVGVHHGRL